MYESPHANNNIQNLASKDVIMDNSSIGSNIDEDDDQTKTLKYINACYVNGLVRNYSEKIFHCLLSPKAKNSTQILANGLGK